MKTLVVDDEGTARVLLQNILNEYGPVDTAADANEALDSVRNALDSGSPYDLICLDIVMEEVDGLQVLRAIRQTEIERQVAPSKVIMITVRTDTPTVMRAVRGQCDHYLAKPIDKAILKEELEKMGLISSA
jgi:two-component system chemotaxis response regulator CheY